MKKTLVPLSQAQMELLVACLTYCESHPSHRDLEIVELRERILFFSLKDKCSEPVKVVPEGSRKKKPTSKFKDTSTDTAIVDIPMPTQSLLDKIHASGNTIQSEGMVQIPVTEMEKMSIVGQRTEKKRKYNKSKLNLPSNNFNA